jgi:hypothetical protein
MPKTKYGKYIVTEIKRNIVEAPWNPPQPTAGKNTGGRFLFLDSEVVEGAFYMECTWVLPRPKEDLSRGGASAHTHDYDEVIAFFGTNPEDFHDLGAEFELWLGDEKHVMTKSFIAFIPSGLSHGPSRFLRVDRPVFHVTTGPGKMYF